jgi:hypothetical protein
LRVLVGPSAGNLAQLLLANSRKDASVTPVMKVPPPKSPETDL